MTPEQFARWLTDMKSAGLARSDAKCAELLGLSANSIVDMKRRGCDRRSVSYGSATKSRLPFPTTRS